MPQNKPAIPESLVRRIILERDLTDTRELPYELPSGETVTFVIRTLSAEEKQRIRERHDKNFPIPPVVQGKLGAPQFDLQDPEFQQALNDWNTQLSRGVLAETLGIDEKGVQVIEATFPREFVNKLFTTIELLNGIQSDPLVELVRDALWAPEVLAWLENEAPKDQADTPKISDTPLFREMDAMIACGLTLEQWEKLSPRHKIMYINYNTYKGAKEAFMHDFHEKRAKDKGNRRV